MFVRRAYIPEQLCPVLAERSQWPFTVPCVAQLVDQGLEFTRPVTLLVGDNGSGKSTLVEAISEGFRLDPYGGRASAMSHGEGFVTMFRAMMNAPGFYVMDEPESALSFTACLHLVALMHQLGDTGAQVVCATHSPILAATPGADIIELGDHGYRRTSWDRLELIAHWRRYLEAPDAYLRHLIDTEEKAERVYATFADLLDTEAGRTAQLTVAARLHSRIASGDYFELAEPLRHHVRSLGATLSRC